MSSKWLEIIGALINNVLVPELVAYLKQRGSTNLPTEEDLKALLMETTTRHILVGEAFLRAHGVET